MKNFIKNALFGGLIVILPIAILGFFFKWLFKTVTDIIQPLTNYAYKIYPVSEFAADLIVIGIILLACFIVGIIVRTKLGNLMHQLFDDVLQQMAPGYRMVKEVVVQVFGKSENSPFANGMVARVKLFGVDCPTEVTALITDHHADGTYTIFMPTGPNPTSGNIFHVNEAQVMLYPDIKLDSAMRTVIACGAGSGELFSPGNKAVTATRK
ncbi:MAG: DUF502 domain-containing protein [Gammaproteobacteria bacterium]|nr:DUF502 domain-containing protein [Gammaproteobacteria bacterium]